MVELGYIFQVNKETPVLSGFVVLEGLDGAGTTTQLHLLNSKAQEEGWKVWTTYEPTQGPIGRLIKSILKGEFSVEPKTLAYLFSADRREHLFNKEIGILSKCSQGYIVVSDRYIFSSLAYQSVECGFNFVFHANSEFPLPEHCIYIDVPPHICERRLKERGEKELFDARQMQEKIRGFYEKSFASFNAKNPGEMKFHRVDGSASIEEVFKNVWSVIRDLPMNKV